MRKEKEHGGCSGGGEGKERCSGDGGLSEES